LKLQRPLDLIFDILRACPDAAAVPDIKNNFPLHIAVINGHRENIVRAIL
jgi:ankyrin repeat protein